MAVMNVHVMCSSLKEVHYDNDNVYDDDDDDYYYYYHYYYQSIIFLFRKFLHFTSE